MPNSPFFPSVIIHFVFSRKLYILTYLHIHIRTIPYRTPLINSLFLRAYTRDVWSLWSSLLVLAFCSQPASQSASHCVSPSVGWHHSGCIRWTYRLTVYHFPQRMYVHTVDTRALRHVNRSMYSTFRVFLSQHLDSAISVYFFEWLRRLWTYHLRDAADLE